MIDTKTVIKDRRPPDHQGYLKSFLFTTRFLPQKIINPIPSRSNLVQVMF